MLNEAIVRPRCTENIGREAKKALEANAITSTLAVAHGCCTGAETFDSAIQARKTWIVPVAAINIVRSNVQ